MKALLLFILSFFISGLSAPRWAIFFKFCRFIKILGKVIKIGRHEENWSGKFYT